MVMDLRRRSLSSFTKGLRSTASEDLETLLGLKDRPASVDAYSKAVYETGELVEVGDWVQVKVWAEFWKGWQDGVVKLFRGSQSESLNTSMVV